MGNAIASVVPSTSKLLSEAISVKVAAVMLASVVMGTMGQRVGEESASPSPCCIGGVVETRVSTSLTTQEDS